MVIISIQNNFFLSTDEEAGEEKNTSRQPRSSVDSTISHQTTHYRAFLLYNIHTIRANVFHLFIGITSSRIVITEQVFLSFEKSFEELMPALLHCKTSVCLMITKTTGGSKRQPRDVHERSALVKRWNEENNNDEVCGGRVFRNPLQTLGIFFECTVKGFVDDDDGWSQCDG